MNSTKKTSLFLNLTIKTIFNFLIGFVLSLQAIFFVIHFKDLNRLEDQFNKVYDTNFMVGKFSTHAKFSFMQIDSAVKSILSEPNGKDLKPMIEELYELEVDLEEDLIVIKERAKKNITIINFITEIEVEMDKLKILQKDFLTKKLKNPKNNLITIWSNLDNAERIFEKLDEINDITSEQGYNDIIISKEQITSSKENFLINTIGIIFFLFLLILILNYLIVKPVHKLSHLFREIATGQFNTIVDHNQYHSDIGILAKSFYILQIKFQEALVREEKAKKALGDFLANMSHELRTPLNAIIGFSTIAIEQFDTKSQEENKEKINDEETKENMVQIQSSGEYLLGLINDILDLSKINSGNFNINNSATDIILVTKDVHSVLKTKCRESKLTFDFNQMGTENLWVMCDAMRVKQILINLVNNAVKFTKEGGVYITLRHKQINDNKVEILFEVRDTGIGIPKDKLEQIFQSFSQAENNTSELYGGTGLGLSISKNLVERMDGKIWVESTIGIGSSFFFTINVDLAKESDKADSIKTEAPGALPNSQSKNYDISILIVEDNDMNIKVLTHYMKGLKYTNYDIAKDGASAIKFALEKNYDLILMDMQLPDMTGIEVTKKIKLSLKDRFPNVIALTANAFESDKEKCFQVGMIDFISKPISKVKLAESLSAVKRKA